jgi:hypothetical protein
VFLIQVLMNWEFQDMAAKKARRIPFMQPEGHITLIPQWRRHHATAPECLCRSLLVRHEQWKEQWTDSWRKIHANRFCSELLSQEMKMFPPPFFDVIVVQPSQQPPRHRRHPNIDIRNIETGIPDRNPFNTEPGQQSAGSEFPIHQVSANLRPAAATPFHTEFSEAAGREDSTAFPQR